MSQITLDVLEERLSNWFAENKSDHAEIIAQTTKTNGSVAKATSEINELKMWRSKMTGALIILNVVIWPLVLLFITKIL